MFLPQEKHVEIVGVKRQKRCLCGYWNESAKKKKKMQRRECVQQKEKLDKWPCWKESGDVCLKEMLQRLTQEEKERFRVPDLLRSNWVSDLLPLCCFPAIRPCVASVIRVCVLHQLNSVRLSEWRQDKLLRARSDAEGGHSARSQWTRQKQKYSGHFDLLGSWRNEKTSTDLCTCT